MTLSLAAQTGQPDEATSVPRAFVDLGLPSGTKWANMNVGATSPEEYGTYFAWGETVAKDTYTWDNYLCAEATCGTAGDPVFALVGSKADIAATKFDAAMILWGPSWRMPTAEQVEELASNCSSTLVTINGMPCRKLVSHINGNEIIFPLAGARWFDTLAYEGTVGYYWSSTLRAGGYVSPGRLIVREDTHGWGWSMGGENDRFTAFPVRAVYVENAVEESTLSLNNFSVVFNDGGTPEMVASAVTFQGDGSGDNYSLSSDGQQAYDPALDISKVSYITRKSIGHIALPESAAVSENDLTITVDGDTATVDDHGNYDDAGSTFVATNADGEIVYMNIASVGDDANAVGANLDAKESALTLMLPLVPNIFVAFDDEYLPGLKEMLWDVEEVKQLAAAIDRSVAKYGYTDFGEISAEATAARNKVSQLLHLDKLAEKQAKVASRAGVRSMPKASGSTESPFIANKYGYGGLQVEITDSEKKQFYQPHNVTGYNCEVTAYNYNRFAYSSMVKGKYDAETNTYYIPDLGDDYDYYKNILKPQKVSTFMSTFTSFKYDDLERLGQFLEESADLLQGDIWFDEMHWSDEKKTAYFDISAQDDAIVLLFPRGNDYMLVYNILQSVVKPVVKMISKKASKQLDSDVVIPVLCENLFGDPDYMLNLQSVLDDPELGALEKIEEIMSITWPKLLKGIDKVFQSNIDSAIKESFTDFVDKTVDAVGGYDAVEDWKVVKSAFKYLSWVKKIGDLVTGTLGTFFEDNAVYPVYWDADGQFVLDQDAVAVGEGESVKVRILVGSGSYSWESSDASVATVSGSYDKVEITGVDAGTATVTVRDRIAQKSARITVTVTGIQTFALSESTVTVPVYEDRTVSIARGDGPFHVSGGDKKIAVATLGKGSQNRSIVISGVSEGTTTFNVFNEATAQTLPLTVEVTGNNVTLTDERIVDLGLSVKWANCNVGANEPQDYGDYFAWGEVTPKQSFSANNYQYYTNGSFVDIGNDISGTQYDAATHNMGEGWRMPTKAEYEELINKCQWKFVNFRGQRGWKVTGPNGNMIFLPAAGSMLYDWNEDESINGFYWSSNVADNNREVHTLFTTMRDYKMYYSHMNRFEGRTIRAVTAGEVTPPDLPVETETFTVNGVSFTMVAVEGGTFWMGAADDDGEADSSERPRHEVTLSSYAIGQTEVTQALWQAVMGSNPSDFQGADHPVEEVSWNDCQKFITKLNALTGRTFRLPTEAEWEYAARGGQNSHGYKYAGGNDIDEVAWYENNADYVDVRGPRPVAQKKANELGLYDMSGNVWEWCQDWYSSSYYSNSPAVNPCNTTSASFRVFRGGSWFDYARGCRVSYRYGSSPGHRYDYLGLRLALSDTGHSSSLTPGEAIDLGLPSGTKWASCNVGASSPEEYGGYYAWGETEEKDVYNWSTYKWMNEGQSSWSQINKYTFADGQTSACWYRDGTFIGDGKTTLDPEDDVATVKWGSGWQMPTCEQMEELYTQCSSEWITLNGVYGRKFTGPNGNSIFLPAAGFRNDAGLHFAGSDGDYWSRSLYTFYSDYAYGLYFHSGGIYWSNDGYRSDGQSVRPVRVPN